MKNQYAIYRFGEDGKRWFKCISNNSVILTNNRDNAKLFDNRNDAIIFIESELRTRMASRFDVETITNAE
jgi:hypothetical protein